MANHQEIYSETETRTETNLSATHPQRHLVSGADRLPMEEPAAILSQVPCLLYGGL